MISFYTSYNHYWSCCWKRGFASWIESFSKTDDRWRTKETFWSNNFHWVSLQINLESIGQVFSETPIYFCDFRMVLGKFEIANRRFGLRPIAKSGRFFWTIENESHFSPAQEFLHQNATKQNRNIFPQIRNDPKCFVVSPKFDFPFRPKKNNKGHSFSCKLSWSWHKNKSPPYPT